MNHIRIKKGLDIPISGEPVQSIRPGRDVGHIALLGDDSFDIRPTLVVAEGDRVKVGQALFSDKNNPEVVYTSPGCGTVVAINRGAKRRFQSLAIAIDGDEEIAFLHQSGNDPQTMTAAAVRATLIASGLWTSLRTRPFGRIPAVAATPASLFVTAVDTEPLAADPLVIIGRAAADFRRGLQVLRRLVACPIHLCSATAIDGIDDIPDLHLWLFSGPHPAGLASTHIHFIDPVHEHKTVWQIGYQDVIAIGHLFRTGRLQTERVIALAGPAISNPGLVTTRIGASVTELCRGETSDAPCRLISGSVLSGREMAAPTDFLGRYHNQVSAVREDSGRSLFNWLMPGRDRFSLKPVFVSAFLDRKPLPMITATWGGRRAIFPIGSYEQVMPLDIIATSLLKSIAMQDSEKAQELGCLELIEEDLALCSFVCPGKNDFGPLLRQLLTTIESGG